MDEAVSTQEAPAQTVLKLPDPLARALGRFASITRKLKLTESLAWSCALVFFLFTIIACLDFSIRMEDSSRRFAALLAYLVCAGVSLWLLRKAVQQPAPAELALTLEKRLPPGEVQERLSTTVELASRNLAGEGLSGAMIERVADEAAAYIAQIDVAACADHSGARLSTRVAGGLLAAIFVLCLIPSLNMPLLYARAFLPWMNLRRPSKTLVQVSPGNAKVVEGESLEIELHTSGQSAAEAFIETREEKGPWQRLRMERESERSFKLKSGPYHLSSEYRAAAGDGLSETFGITVFTRPEVTGLSLTVQEPAYTGRPAQTFERVNGDLSALKGSRVEIAVKANTALAGAALDFEADHRSIPLQVQTDASGQIVCSGRFDITKDTRYRIQLRSKDGVDNPDAPLFSIRALPDLPPQVTVIKPLADESVDSATVLNLETRAEDDIAVKSMRLVAQSTQRTAPLLLPLKAPGETGKVWMISQPWDLAGLFLADGETLTYRVEAVDSNGSVGRSDERKLRIESGQKHHDRRLLSLLEDAQSHLLTAEKLFRTTQKDTAQLRDVFRAEDIGFQAADRMLLDEALRRIGREVRSATASIEKGKEYAEAGPLATLLEALGGALTRYADTGIQPLEHAAKNSTSEKAAVVTAGLDTLSTLLPQSQKTLEDYHQGLSAAQRFVSAGIMVSQSTEISDSQKRIAPILVGSSGWTPRGTFVPGLMAEYYSGVNFDNLVRRTVETKIEMVNKPIQDIGATNFSIRWTGQILAPRTGHYSFRIVPDDGARLNVDGKRIIDEWRMQPPTPFEAGIELSEGWHGIVLEFMQGAGTYEISLQRSGPGLKMDFPPPEHLRNSGAGAALHPEGEIREAMAKPASAGAVENAWVRLQTMLDSSRTLPADLKRVASLLPKIDSQGQKDAEDWTKEVFGQTSALKSSATMTFSLAQSVLQWRGEAGQWVERYKAVRERYRQEMLNWSRQLQNETLKVAAELKHIKQEAQVAQQAFADLAKAVQEPNAARRAAEMAKADATVRAIADDLRTQAEHVAHELKEAAADTRRPIEEREVMQALAQRAEEARDTAAEMEKRLNEAKDAEALAQTVQKTPNVPQAAAALQQQADQLAQQAEKMERTVALRNSLDNAAKDLAEAHEAATRPETPAAAAAEQHAAAEVAEAAKDVQEKLDAARTALDGQTAAKADQLAQSMKASKAAEALQQDAARTEAGAPQTPNEAEARKQAAAELQREEQMAKAAAVAAEQQLAAQAQALNGDDTQALHQAAATAQQSNQALAAVPTEKQAAMNRAAQSANSAEHQAENAADRIALEAEALREHAADKAQQQQADDLVRLAAAVRAEAKQNLEPAAEALDQQRGEHAQNDAQANAVAKAASAVTKKAADDLNQLADVAAGLRSNDANQRAQAEQKLEKILEGEKIAARTETAVQKGDALDQAGKKLAEEANKDGAAPTAAQLEAERQELAKVEGADADRQALAKAAAAEAAEVAQKLRQEAEHERQVAGVLDRAAGLGEHAREDLKKEAPALAKALRDAGKKAADAAQQAQGQPAAAPLNDAGQALPQAGDATEKAAANADNAPAGELAKQLDDIAKGLEKPVGELAGALNGANEKQTNDIQQGGQEARAAAGREAELAEALQNAARAENVANAQAQADTGDRKQLEAEVRAAIAALEKNNPGAKAEDLAAAAAALDQNAPGAQQQGQQGQQGGQNGEKPDAQQGGQGQQQAGEGGEKQDGQQGGKGQQQGGQQGQQQVGKGAQGQQAQGGKSTEAALEAQAGQTRANAERLDAIAEKMERIAASAPVDANAPGQGQGNEPSQTPAADALQALTKAEAAAAAGDGAEAKALEKQAAALLDQAAEAAHGQATGMQTPGSAESQTAMAQGQNGKGQGQGKGKGQQPGKNQGQGSGKGAQAAYAAQAKPGTTPPNGIPIDKATWNRLPDSVRRDLLNASGSRFPAEYEASISRYFKNVASSRRDK